MKLFLGMVLGWLWSKIVARNPFPRLTAAAAQKNAVPIITPDVPADNDEFIVETRDASPAHFLAKFESFSLFPIFSKYKTREFEAGSYKWKLIIYPNGYKKGFKHVCVSLALAETSSLPVGWEFNAIFTIFLYNQILDNYLCFRVKGPNGRRFNETKLMWGSYKLISRKFLEDESNGYLVDNNLVLGAEVSVLERQTVIERVTLLTPLDERRSWKISDFSKLREDIWFSEDFVVRDIKKMQVYPNGDSNSKGRYMSIYLVCVSADTFDANQKVMAEFSATLKRDTGRTCRYGKIRHWFTSSDKICKRPDCACLALPRDPENGNLVNDECTVEVEISVHIVV